jgi:membrane-bound ClpP family serine protease
MSPIELILLLVAAAVVLLVGELLLPTHGLLGFAGLAMVIAALVVVFQINRWIGLGVLCAALVLSPVIFNGAVKLWAKSPIGKRIILQPIESKKSSYSVELGQHGLAVTELRPVGECDFGEQRLEAASELGIIAAGKPVKIIAVINGRPVVRAIETGAPNTFETKTT